MPLTPSQELAAQSRGGARLVSAAAGSGKTKVLVERLMRYVDDGEDIDRFLVITYTRAAAGELRSRILQALNERIAADPTNRRLRRQTELCCRASIGTIDSLCGRFLRENTHLAGIVPDYKVIEPERSEAILRTVLERLLEELYADMDRDPGLAALVDTYGAGRDDTALTELVLQLHAAVQSQRDPRGWLRQQREEFSLTPDTDAGETPWGKTLMEEAGREAAFWAGQLEALLAQMALPGREKLMTAYGESLAVAAEGMRDMDRACGIGWESVRTHCAVEFPRLKSYRGEDALSATVKAVWNTVKKAAKRWQETFSDPSEVLVGELIATRGAIEALLRLTERLDEAFAAEKKRQGVVDFSDQEHMVLRLLEDPSTGLAESLSRQYAEVLVDEYQDVNACQDELFHYLSDHGKKLFLVGDVKQSIYRFRLADPTIFLKRYSCWNDVTPDTPPEMPGRIFLRENFRSRREVIDSVNHVFRNIMSRSLGELDYDGDAALRPGQEYPEGAGGATELALLSLPEETDEERPDKVLREARWIAERIRGLVDEGTMVTDRGGLRPARYGDFAILLRSNKSATPQYRAALAALGIPSVSQQGGGFFASTEVTMLLSLLAVIDNPRQDVALIAALRSPLFGFTPDELSRIRAGAPRKDFYTALVKAGETDVRCRAFLETLEGYRRLAAELSVEELLGRICDDTDFIALLSAMPDGHARRENVALLLDYARQFEADGYRGLFRFLAWMKRLEERGEEKRSGAVEAQDAVQIISIHHSKGLEYPIVFLAGTAKHFNKTDLRRPVLIHSGKGIGSKVIDTKRGIIYPSLAWRAVKTCLDREGLSEEMRLLYVAMTRAKDRLFITCLMKDPEKVMEELQSVLTSPLPPEVLAGDSCPARWLLRCAMLPDSPIRLTVETLPEKLSEAEAAPSETAAGDGAEQAATALRETLQWVYPHTGAAGLPSKLTASTLKDTLPAEEDGAALLPEKPRREPRRPDFARKDAPLTGAERGIAVHKLMQCMDYAAGSDREAVSAEIARLLASGHLTEAQARSIDPGIVVDFFRSPIGQRLLNADRVWRELRFSLLTGAEEFYPAAVDEEILVQGVVDCCIREGDTLTVLDFKTDGVRGEALQTRAREYAPQLRTYASALQRMIGLPVTEGVLFFLRAGETVNIPL